MNKSYNTTINNSTNTFLKKDVFILWKHTNIEYIFIFD